MERQTIQKKLVYDTVCAMCNHPTAQEVFEKLHEEHPTVSRATVYRVLNVLAEQGRILKIPVADTADHFDYNTKTHVHYACRRCGTVGDVEIEAPSLYLPPATDGYRLEGYTILYHGLCGECSQKE